ncbi:hypothetical protein [Candidatus Korobacter versatilis]|nr:hypothetical protein [Candidatus Koribacter versatilis]
MIEKVREWLENQGFPLEMRAAAVFRSEGFDVRQSSHYTDPETGKAREIDVLAIDPDPVGVVGIAFVVECKSTKKPWILLSSEHVLDGYSRSMAFARTSQQGHEALVRKIDVLVEKVPWLTKSGLLGYALKQALSETDTAYAASIGLAKATADWVSGRSGRNYVVGFAFPVLVVDSPICVCYLDEHDNLRLEQTRRGEFLFSTDPPKNFGTCIRVVHIDELPAFAKEARRVAQTLRSELKDLEDRIMGEISGPKRTQRRSSWV